MNTTAVELIQLFGILSLALRDEVYAQKLSEFIGIISQNVMKL